MARLATGAALCGALLVGLNGCDAVKSLPGVSQLPFFDETPTVAEGMASLSVTPDAQLVSPTIREEGTLTVGIDTNAALAPMCITGDGGAITGIDVDLASTLADQLGLKVKFVSIVGTDDATANTCDIVMDVSPDAVSDSTVVGSYSESASAFFHKGEAGTVAVADLEGKKVGVQSGSVSERALNKTGLDMNEQPYANLNEAFDALESGDIDYVLCDAYAGAYLAHTYSDLAFAGSLDAPATRGIAVMSSNTTLQGIIQQALETAQSNGTYESVRARWIGDFPTLTSDQQIADIPEGDDSDDESADEDADATDTADGGEATGAGANAVTLTATL